MPACLYAQTNGGSAGNGNDPDNPFSPPNNPCVYISTNQNSSFAVVCFVSSMEDAEIEVYLDGAEVDSLTITATAGTQIPLSLSAYGTGELTIYVRRGTTLLAYYSTSI
jgi:hypothetical protein